MMRQHLRVLFDPGLLLLNALSIALSPLLLLAKATRLLRKKLRREFDFHRWQCPVWNASQLHVKDVPTQKPLRVVLLGTGLGEMQIVEKLSASLSRTHPNVEITWATRDYEAALAAREAHPQQPISFLPFDFIVPTLQFLRHNRPDVVVFVEKFWFPNLARGCAAWGAQCVVVNARTRSHEGFRYRLMRPYHRWILRGFSRMCFQSEEDLQRVQAVLPASVETQVAGNLKFEVDPRGRAVNDALKAWLDTRGEIPLLAAGSTADDEEDEFVFQAFEKLRAAMPCALLIAPRRIHRAEAIAERATARGWTVSRRSEYSNEDDVAPHPDVFCLDTVGELAVAYRYAQAAYIGGTLNSAGHNMAEPLYWGVTVSYGPSRGFFETVKKACEAAGVGFCVRTPDELAAHWNEALSNAQSRALWQRRAYELLSQQCGALERNAQEIRKAITCAMSGGVKRGKDPV
jgi:3-deoxy-D-manno-octulosonic-acid transferase